MSASTGICESCACVHMTECITCINMSTCVYTIYIYIICGLKETELSILAHASWISSCYDRPTRMRRPHTLEAPEPCPCSIFLQLPRSCISRDSDTCCVASELVWMCFGACRTSNWIGLWLHGALWNGSGATWTDVVLFRVGGAAWDKSAVCLDSLTTLANGRASSDRPKSRLSGKTLGKLLWSADSSVVQGLLCLTPSLCRGCCTLLRHCTRALGTLLCAMFPPIQHLSGLSVHALKSHCRTTEGPQAVQGVQW